MTMIRPSPLLFLAIFLPSSSLSPSHPHPLPLASHIGLPPVDHILAGAWESFKNLLNVKKGDSLHEIIQLKRYLARFGYLNHSSAVQMTNLTAHFDNNTETALKLYQESFNLTRTGVLDRETLLKILTPRCGREDVVGGVSVMLQPRTRRSRSHSPHNVAHYTYFPNRPQWPASRRQLTYAFSEKNETQRVPRDQRHKAFLNAFTEWAAVVPLSFVETDDFENADVKIEFVSYSHGDGEPFDGILGILAHAFSPDDGRFHLDNSEYWTTDVMSEDNPQAIDLQSVVTHEIGHLLGLGHSAVQNAIMYPSIAPHQIKVQLQDDDIQGVQSLYGANPGYKASIPLPGVPHKLNVNMAFPAASFPSVNIYIAAFLLFLFKNMNGL